ncbi:NPC intracellular cholesterol transporter 1 homolog 1b-like [Cloeon dipterum]|uniref:NPC intracellular cholesterol transporter 1 homolog 1b-like n=1 Tax=Cloeon dipterum TaxID=197152 RepID=UPI00321FD38B
MAQLKGLSLLAALILLCQVKTTIGEAHCVWYEQCITEPSTVNCIYNGTAKPVETEEGLEILRNRCPHFINEDGSASTCCDLAQMRSMDKSIQMAAGLLQRCPSCYRNLLQQICGFTCGHNQSDYIELVDTKPIAGGKVAVYEINVYLTSRYMNETFEACSEVIMPSSGQLALDASCGIWGAKQCTPQRMFDFLGDHTNNPFVPFQINYLPMDEPEGEYVPLDPYTARCSEAFSEGSWPCSCVDCSEACPAAAPASPPAEPCMVGVINCSSFAAIIIFSVVTVAAAVFVIFLKYRKRKRAYSNDSTETASSSEADADEALKPMFNAGDKMTEFLERVFFRLGLFCGRHPAVVLGCGAVFVLVLLQGIFLLEVTTDPVKLWASPTSRSRLEKNFFDSRFRPFYRTEQIFFKAVNMENVVHQTADGEVVFGPVFNKTFLETIFKLQEDIQLLGEDIVGAPLLKDVCNAPMTNAFTGPRVVEQCLVQSVFGFFNNDWDKFNEVKPGPEGSELNYLDHMQSCIQNPYNPVCFAPYNGPVLPSVGLGGYLPPGELSGDASDMIKAQAIVLTILVDNYLEPEKVAPAYEWEKNFIAFMKRWEAESKPGFMEIAYNSERSIEDELDRTSQAEVYTVLISYLVMFVYISIALGRIRSIKTIPIDSKVTLAVGGILVVLISVACSLGIFGYAGVPTTLLVIEVIPFLVLAVGVDNIFILVQRVQREPVPKHSSEPAVLMVGRALGHVGPSMLLTSVSEITCFFLGALSEMPAVNTFSLNAACALLIDFILQITCFVSLLVLDTKRQTSGRVDVLCCLKPNPKKTADVSPTSESRGFLYKFFGKYYAPFLMKEPTRLGVLLLFFAWLCTSIAVVPVIPPGLDQELSMPEDSFVLKYFQYMKDLLAVGPPVYFVVKAGPNYSSPYIQDAMCGGQRCRSDSVFTELFAATRNPEGTYLANAPSSWLDDYFDWTLVTGCCKYFALNDSFCPHNYGISQGCSPCEISYREDGVRPVVEDFEKYISFFLQDNPDSNCAKGGRAAYAQGVNYVLDDEGAGTVGDTYFMGYHTPLRTSHDFYEALRSVREISAKINDRFKDINGTSIEMFPYSVFYVYYEQYLTIWNDAIESIGISLLAIFIVTFLLTGLDIVSATVVLVTILSITLNMAGIMYWWTIELNAVSLVNLVMCAGISVEFCSHIVHSYTLSTFKDPVDRARDSLTNMGSSVFSGITLTKFGGIIVLAFAKSQIFQVFYFRMYLGIVIVGATHGLILLPVILSYVGKWTKRKTAIVFQGDEENGDTDSGSEKPLGWSF